MIEIGLLILSSILNILLGLVVYLKNPKSATNKLFVVLTASFALWSGVNYLSVHPVLLPQIIWVRLVLVTAAFLCLAVYLTFTVFPSYTLVGNHRHQQIAVISTGLVMLWTLTPFVFALNEAAKPVAQPGILAFTALVTTLLSAGIYNLVKKYRHAKGIERVQIRLVLFGLAGTFTLIFLTNFLLVAVFNNTSLIPLGPTYTLLFTGTVAYAIVKHRLFDIRATAARGLAYLLSFGVIGLVYGGLVFGVSILINHQDNLDTTQRMVYIGLAIVTAIVFPVIKHFFDRVTNRVFFRDAYDPQSFLDVLNKVLVSTIELDSLLTQTSQALRETLKSDTAVFMINATSYSDEQVIGATQKTLDPEMVKYILAHAHSLPDRVTVIDYLDAPHLPLKHTLLENNVSVLVRLSAQLSRNQGQRVGYLVLGPKRSGDPYNSVDVRILDIIASELVIAIQNALRFSEIQAFNLTLQEKIDDATRKLRKTNEKLRQLDETKDDFISMASHQLRTPLTSIKGYVSMVMEGDAGKITSKQQKLLDQAFISSQRMVYLIADLLNVSRLKTGKFVIEAKPTNLADVISGEIEQLKETAKGRGLKLEYSAPKNFPMLNLDETKIRQVIMNFADNAIYYTPTGGTVTVNLVDKPDSIEMTVVDNGIGVSKDEQHHLFSKFFRANNAKKARPDGTGLGLFMAQKVIIAQGGAIIFHSEENKGSTFGFSFPKSKLLVK